MSVNGSAIQGRLRYVSGATVPGDRWMGDAGDADERVLERCEPPVLDVGCGPARHTVALAEKGVPTLGIDITPGALSIARPREAMVLERDVFDRVPATGRWGTVLLLDGNVGIGGDPSTLLWRSRELLRPGGKILVELTDGCDTAQGAEVRLELDDLHGPWFGWTTVDREGLRDSVNSVSDLSTQEVWCDDARWFAELIRHGRP